MQGMITVFWKELADHFTSWRFIILFAIVFAVGIYAIYNSALYIREAVSDTEFVFLLLYTTSGNAPLPLFIFFFFFFLPIIGIALGFDAINSEKNSGTLSRLMSQPIFRDAVINGKFLAGTATIAIMVVSIVLIVAGIGLWIIGVPPTEEEVGRLMAFVALSIIYGAFWLGLGILFSIFIQRVATSALASIAVWIFLAFLFLFPVFITAEGGQIGYLITYLSPITVFQEAVAILLIPGYRILGFMAETASKWMLPTPLSLGQSLLIAWPHLVGLIALTAICFAISYIKFMREEIRST